MTSLTDQELIEKYADCMQELKVRTEIIRSFLTKQRSTGYIETDVEFICLQFRKKLELIALANLVSNSAQYSEQYKNFERHYHAERILKDIEKINPEFYPRATEQILDPQTGKVLRVEDVQNGALTKEEFLSIYSTCSEYLHAQNPFGVKKDFKELIKDFGEWNSKIIKLLNHHIVQLADVNKSIWTVMHSNEDGKVRCHIFERIEKNTEPNKG